MMHYQDVTFCTAPCDIEDCVIKATPEVERQAARAGLPLSLADRRNACKSYLPLVGCTPCLRCQPNPCACATTVISP